MSWVTARDSANRAAPRATTAGSSLEMSASRASPREHAAAMLLAVNSSRVLTRSMLTASCNENSRMSYPAATVCEMADSTLAGLVSPTHTSA